VKTNRRDFFKTAGAGVAVAGLSAALPAAAQTASKVEKGQAASKVETTQVRDYAAPLVPVNRKREGWPIRSELKSKRIKFDTPQNHISWAYMKEMRENNKTRKIYPVNPYVEVYQLRDNEYELFSENCDGLGDFFMHLIIGPERAMLIDCGYGLGDVKGLVDQLTGSKPLIVVNTHEHPDHAFGNCRFDKVYCHKYLVPALEQQNAHMFDYLFDDYGDNIWLQFDKKDLPTFKKYEIVGVEDGHKFNLGGDYEIELIFTGGHSPGHAGYLDKKNRIFYSGDNICSDVSSCGSVNMTRPGPYGENTALKVYRDNVKRLVDRIDEYDYIFPNHFMTNLENNLMPNILEACDAILANPEDCDYKVEKWNKGGTESAVRYCKFIRGFSIIVYGYKKA
jgi:glyoxylase-like metal-dependent hydrolase (beta-lactamase superfamily II)